MVDIQVGRHLLRVRLHGWDVVRAMRASVSVPLSHVTGVRARPPEARFDEFIVDAWRGVGTYMPGSMAVGTVMLRDGRSFFDVHGADNVVAIDLAGEKLRHLVVEVEGEIAENTVRRIRRALDARAAPSLG